MYLLLGQFALGFGSYPIIPLGYTILYDFFSDSYRPVAVVIVNAVGYFFLLFKRICNIFIGHHLSHVNQLVQLLSHLHSHSFDIAAFCCMCILTIISLHSNEQKSTIISTRCTRSNR